MPTSSTSSLALQTTPPAITPTAMVNELLDPYRAKDVCGYVLGNKDIPWLCPNKGACLYNPEHQIAGCCYSEPATIVSVCLDYTAYEQGACNEGSVGPGTSCCVESAYPHCVTYSYEDIPASMVWCSSSRPTGTVMIRNDRLTGPPPTPTPKPTESQYAATDNESKTTSNGNNTTDKEGQDKDKEDMSSSDKIALGVGIPFGILGAVGAMATVYMCVLNHRKKGTGAIRPVGGVVSRLSLRRHGRQSLSSV